jgi:hypothetical protein
MNSTNQFSRRNPLRLSALLLTGIFTSTTALAAMDPFVGTWVYNTQKSPKPTIRYTIKDLGDNRYALTGSTGVTVEIKADGKSIKTSTGATVSFKKLDDRQWKMIRDDGEKMVRTYSISPDDKQLTLVDLFANNPIDNYELTTKYVRLSAGKSIFGEWQSVSMEEVSFGEPLKMIITPFEINGLSFSIPAHKHLSEIKFDGKMYADRGAGDPAGGSSSGRRISDHLLEIDSRLKGEPEETAELKVSDDGKTLTIVRKMAKSTATFTMVWDKR